MGLLDRFKRTAQQAKGAVNEHADQIDKGIDKVAGVVDDKTGGKQTDKIGKVADKAHDLVGKLDDDGKT